MTTAELTAIAATAVGGAQRQLPPELRPLARAVPVHYQAQPAADVLADGFPPDILGLFSGTAYDQEVAEDAPQPPQIILYLDNLWAMAEGDLDLFRDEARITYLHELGHYLGWDEDDLTARGLD